MILEGSGRVDRVRLLGLWFGRLVVAMGFVYGLAVGLILGFGHVVARVEERVGLRSL